ncbi:MAG TPA: hypothetical protein VJY40_08555 [Corynebacterium sp.]|nr:hypothetical protein [Corynebacterium sp.]
MTHLLLGLAALTMTILWDRGNHRAARDQQTIIDLYKQIQELRTIDHHNDVSQAHL